MTDPARRSPLAHLADTLAAASSDAVSLREAPFLAQVDVRAGEPSALLPAEANTVREARGRRALWLGPDEWLVVGAAGEERAIEAELRGALGDGLAALVDVSANRTALELSGPRARDVLMKGCALDLHPRALGPGRCAQTAIARTQVILEQLSAEPAYRLHVRPSFAQHLALWLLDAMEEFAADAQAALAAAAQDSPSRASISERQRSVRATSLNV